MGLATRLPSASGAAAAGTLALLLSQRFPGTASAAVLLTVTATAAGPAVAIGGGELSRRSGAAALARQMTFAPAWALASVAACFRAGSAVIADLAGAHAVAGLSLIRGPIATVAGMWLCVIAASIAIAGSLAHRTVLAAGGAISQPHASRRLAILGFTAQVGLVAALFAGPQVREATDAIPWLAAGAAVGAGAWFGRHLARLPAAPIVAGALSAAGLILTLAGGRP